MPQSSISRLFPEDINLNDLFEILSPQNNLVLADDMMLSDANGTILQVSETYEKNFGFAHGSIVGKSAFDLEADGTFSPCITAEIIRTKKKITTTQTINHTHTNVMTVGIPLFDGAGNLKYAVCFNTVSMEQINAIHRNFQQMQDSLTQYSQEIAELRTRNTATSLVWKSRSMQRLWTLMQNTANTRANILITGETGVGKSAVAKTIHAMSDRADKPFIEVNCAVLHENLIESELFGYEKGAFTGALGQGNPGKFELADGGTIFLDEIGELPLEIQSKLLRVLDSHRIFRIGGKTEKNLNIRVIAATNRDLQKEVRNYNFREDLYYRINVLSFHIVPLRERIGDVPLLANYFIGEINRRGERESKIISPECMRILEQHTWPGNVRELQNVILRAYYCSGKNDVILPEHLPDDLLHPLSNTRTPQPKQYSGEDTAQKEKIEQALSQCNGDTKEACKQLGVSRATLYRYLNYYNIQARTFKAKTKTT